MVVTRNSGNGYRPWWRGSVPWDGRCHRTVARSVSGRLGSGPGTGGGAGGAKGGDQEERRRAKHTPNTGSGSCDPGARARTEGSSAKKEGEVHRALPPH